MVSCSNSRKGNETTTTKFCLFDHLFFQTHTHTLTHTHTHTHTHTCARKHSVSLSSLSVSECVQHGHSCMHTHACIYTYYFCEMQTNISVKEILYITLCSDPELLLCIAQVKYCKVKLQDPRNVAEQGIRCTEACQTGLSEVH